MTAVRRDLTVEQGVTFSAAWTVQLDGVPLDDTWQARSQVRESKRADVVLHEFDCHVLAGVVELAVPADESTAWLWRRGVYDVEVFNPDGRVVRILEGSVIVRTEVTR